MFTTLCERNPDFGMSSDHFLLLISLFNLSSRLLIDFKQYLNVLKFSISYKYLLTFSDPRSDFRLTVSDCYKNVCYFNIHIANPRI